MRLFINSNTVINVDNDTDAERLAADPATERELTLAEIVEIFGIYPHLAGPHNTTIDPAGKIVFTLPLDHSDLAAWLDRFVRPQRDEKLKSTDKYMVSDFPVSPVALDQWTAYREDLRNFPASLVTIVDPIPWPISPADGGQA